MAVGLALTALSADPDDSFERNLAAVSYEGQSGARGGLTIPGGRAFVVSVVEMGGASDSDFMHRLAEFLEEPGMLTRADRLDEAVGHLLDLRERQSELDRKYGMGSASLARPGTYAYDKAEELLDWLGVRVRTRDGEIKLEIRDGNTQRARRQAVAHLGYETEKLVPGWAVGDTLTFVVPMEEVPILFGRRDWENAIFQSDRGPVGVFIEFLRDAAARRVLVAYGRMDPATRQALADSVGLRRLYEDGAVAQRFAELAPYLRSEEGRIAPPGKASIAWQEILGDWESDAELVRRLTTKDRGKPAHLWRALSLVPERLAAYLMTMGTGNADEQRAWAKALYRSIELPVSRQTLRWRGDVAELFMTLRLNPAGTGLEWPAGGRAWALALRRSDVLDNSMHLAEEIQRGRDYPEAGPAIDRIVLGGLVAGQRSRDQRYTAVERFLGTTSVLRRLPEATTPRTAILLFRNYEAYGSVLGPVGALSGMSGNSLERMVFQLHRIDRLPELERDTALRQLQATVLILGRMFESGLVARPERDGLLRELFSLSNDDGGMGLGRPLMQWFRSRLLPMLETSLEAEHPTDGSRQGTIVAALARPGAPIEFSLQGIDYRYDPWPDKVESLRSAILNQGYPELGLVLDLDSTVASALSPDGEDPASRASELRSAVSALWSEFRASLSTDYLDGADDARVPLARDRDEVPARIVRTMERARQSKLNRQDLSELRRDLGVWFTDALVATAYSAFTLDPTSVFVARRSVAGLHASVTLGREDGEVLDILLPTTEKRDPEFGNHLVNSLAGMPEALGQWLLRSESLGEDMSMALLPATRAWGRLLASAVHASLAADAQRQVAERVAKGRAWLAAASAAGESDLTPPWAQLADAMTLAQALRLQLRPNEWRAVLDRLEAQDQTIADELGAGELYLMVWGVDDGLGLISSKQRIQADQIVGMPDPRSPPYGGLRHPPRIPVGEGADATNDPAIYDRLIGLRVNVALGLETSGYPAALQPVVLPIAMAQVLGTIRPDSPAAWQELSAAIRVQVTPETVTGWLLDLAFEGVFEAR